MIQTAKLNGNVAAPASGVRHGARKASLTQCHAMKPDQQGPVENMKRFALAAGAAVLLMAEPSSAIAKATKPAPTQGTAFDEIIEQQKTGKIKAKVIKSKTSSSDKPVYGQQKKTVIPKAGTSKSATKKTVTKVSKKAEAFKASTAPLKFSSKASTGTQGSAPAGVALPVPKGAVTKVAPKPKATAPAPKPKATAPAPKPKATAPAPKPKAPAPKTDNPLARKKAAAAAGAAAVVLEQTVEKVAPPPAIETPTVSKVKNYVKNTPAVKAPVEKKAQTVAPAISFGGDAAEAGAVAAAEVIGLLVASSAVNAILKPSKPVTARRS